MRPLIMLMLAVQAGIFLATALAVVTARGTAEGRRKPVWATFAIALVIVAGTSWNIGEDHPGEPGADILLYASPLLLGMGIMAALLLIRQRRGLDGPA